MEKKRENQRIELTSEIANLINFDGHKVFCIGTGAIDLIVGPTDDGRYSISIWMQSGRSRKQVFSSSWRLSKDDYATIMEDTMKAKENIYYVGINGLVADAVARSIMRYFISGLLYPGKYSVEFDDITYIIEWQEYVNALIQRRKGKATPC